MAIYKNKDIQANINNKSVDLGNIGVNFYTEDDNTSSIRIYIKRDGQPINLNKIDMKPQLDLFLKDGSIFLNESVDVVLPESGLILYIIPTKVIKHIGKVDAKLFLKSEENSVHVANFNFNILDSGVEDAIEKEVSVNIVDDAIKKIINEQPELFKGEKGDKGDIGPQGIQGKQGVKGEQGIQGVKGDTGSQGIQGEKGEKGDKGDKGDSVLASPKIYTRDEYNQLETKDSNTLYFISEV